MRLSVVVVIALGISSIALVDGPRGARADGANNTSSIRKLAFRAESPAAARIWQKQVRSKLFELLMGGSRPQPVEMEVALLRRETPKEATYHLEELHIRSRGDRLVHAWLAVPRAASKRPAAAILAIHGHGGSGAQVVHGESLYDYGKRFAEAGYVVIAPDVESHTLQDPTWSLMGERTWDCIRCLDYLCARPEVDKDRIGTAGLSLGGETVMYVAALDERIKVAVSSGWITTVENMKQGHCPCWNFPGLEEHFEFADIFALVAPRPLVLENGSKDRNFPSARARHAFGEIQRAYRVLNAPDQVTLDVFDGGHEFHGTPAMDWIDAALRRPSVP
jgi:dienelactone hydrolase